MFDFLKKNKKNTANEKFDFTTFTRQEKRFINSVLKDTVKKYPKEYHAIGLAKESQAVIGKARHVLHDIIVLAYGDSPRKLDKYAVGLAYATKGAFHRTEAIRYIEEAISQMDNADFTFVHPLHGRWGIYGLLSELYEKEYDIDKALYYSQLVPMHRDDVTVYDPLRIAALYKKKDVNLSVKYLSEVLGAPMYSRYQDVLLKELHSAQAAAEKGYVYKPRKSKQADDDKLREKDLRVAAESFYKNSRLCK